MQGNWQLDAFNAVNDFTTDCETADAITALLNDYPSMINSPITRSGFTVLHVVCLRGMKMSATVLLDAGACPDVKTLDGWTPLHVAAHCCRADIVSILLHRGADSQIAILSPKYSYPAGYTCWEIARSRRKQSVIDAIAAYGYLVLPPIPASAGVDFLYDASCDPTDFVSRRKKVISISYSRP